MILDDNYLAMKPTFEDKDNDEKVIFVSISVPNNNHMMFGQSGDLHNEMFFTSTARKMKTRITTFSSTPCTIIVHMMT